MRKKTKPKLANSKSNKKNIILITILIILVAIVTLRLQDFTGRVADSSTISLLVQDDDDNFIDGAVVELLDDTNNFMDSLPTTTTGPVVFIVTHDDYKLRVTKDGHRTAMCEFTIDEDKILLTNLELGTGVVSCSTPPLGTLYTTCATAHAGWYWRAGSDRRSFHGASCTLKVYTDDTYSVSCLPRGSHGNYAMHGWGETQGPCQGLSKTGLNIDDIGSFSSTDYTGVTVTGSGGYAEEYVCIDNICFRDEVDGNCKFRVDERVKVKKQDDSLTLTLNSIHRERVESNNWNDKGDYNIYTDDLCTVDISGLTLAEPAVAVCGNDLVEGNEDCDGTNFPADVVDCTDLGCTGGTLACDDTDCTFDTSACTGCTEAYEGEHQYRIPPITGDIKYCDKPADEFCTEAELDDVLVTGDDCDEDYECEDNICSDGKCVSYNAVVYVVCSFVDDSTLSGNLQTLYDSFNC